VARSLARLEIGQGSFAWWTKGAKTETKTGKRRPPLRLGWNDFAAVMENLIKEKDEKKKKKRHKN
jgi:hypothetical protein